MADYSYIAQPQVPDSFKTIGSMMNMAGQAQNLQMNNLNLQQKSATLPADIARIQAESRVSQETAAPRIAQANTESQAAQFKLSGDQNAKAMQIAGGLIQDPRIAKSDPVGTIDAANEAYSQMVASGIPKNTADFWASQIKAKAHQPDGALQLLQNVTRANAGSGAQAGVINAPVTMVQTPQGSIEPLQLQPGAPGAVQPVPLKGNGVIPAGLPPSQLQTPTTDVLGQPVIAEKDQSGAITYKPAPGTNTRPVMAFVPRNLLIA